MKKEYSVAELKEKLGSKYIFVTASSALLCLAVWMLIDSEKPEHQPLEKASVALMKDIWSFEAGIVLTAVALVAIAWLISSIKKVRKEIALKS